MFVAIGQAPAPLSTRLRLAPFLQEDSREQAWLTVKAGIFTLRTGLRGGGGSDAG